MAAAAATPIGPKILILEYNNENISRPVIYLILTDNEKKLESNKLIKTHVGRDDKYTLSVVIDMVLMTSTF